jgi:ArsR family transcriptional regulator
MMTLCPIGSYADSVLEVSKDGRDRESFAAQAELFRLLGHPARLQIIELLRDGERSVGDLQRELGLDSSGTSQHLTAMRRQNVLESRRAGTSVLYRISDSSILALLELSKGVLAAQLRRTSVRINTLVENISA